MSRGRRGKGRSDFPWAWYVWGPSFLGGGGASSLVLRHTGSVVGTESASIVQDLSRSSSLDGSFYYVTDFLVVLTSGQ